MLLPPYTLKIAVSTFAIVALSAKSNALLSERIEPDFPVASDIGTIGSSLGFRDAPVS